MLNRLLILLFILTLASCADKRQKRKDIVAEKIVMINENRTELEKLTMDILDDPFVNQQLGKFISPSQLGDKLKERLIKQGLIRISVQKQDNCTEVEYLTDWTEYPVGSLYLTWTTCDSVQTRKGYYMDNFNTNFIEVWGVGNNWLIWIDSDFI
jgi:hypothetical protein